MRTLLLFAAALFLAAAPSAQNVTQTGTTDYRASFQADLERLDREIQALDRQARTDMRADINRFRQDYDELRTTANDNAISDPVAAERMRQNNMRRYDELSRDVYQARLRSAPNRSAYLQTAMDRMDHYDRQIENFRARYNAAPANMRAEYAQDLISLRQQRDQYRDEVFGVRGMTRTGFNDTARQQATSRLTRFDTDFMSARRDAMMRSSDMEGVGQSTPRTQTAPRN